MNIGYMIYQTERTPTPAEQRAIDTRNGEIAASITRWLRELTARLRGDAVTCEDCQPSARRGQCLT